MRAIWMTKTGGPEVLEVRESPDPEPRDGQVRIRTRAVGLNFAEVAARRGLYPDAPKPPCVLGYEGAGVVDAVGPGATRWAPGDRVVFLSQFGGHADVVCLQEDQLFAMPQAMSFEEGAALPVNYLTAYHMLFVVRRVRGGDVVLVHMAAGGVGTAVLQLCRSIGGITTIGTASAGKHDYVRAQGCDHAIDYRSVDYVDAVRRLTKGRGVDLVLDALGGPDWRKGYSLLAPGGLLIAYGLANASTPGGVPLLHALGQLMRQPFYTCMKLMNDNRSVAGVNIGHLFGERSLVTSEMEAILALYRDGKIKPHVGSVFPFSRVADAHRELESRRNLGKVVLTPT